jgi:predicted RNA binding protein YcfA (HicA-like mRNA interferase family)
VNPRKVLAKARNNQQDVRFTDLLTLAEALGYRLDRITGSHRILVHPVVPKRLSLQPRKDGKAKPYQVDQLLKIIDQYGLVLEEDR